MSGPGSDAALLNAIRSGDQAAYDVLRARHGMAASRLASHVERGQTAAADVVDWAFTQVLDAIRRGGGPTDAFRPYLLTAVRRAARDCALGHATPVPTDEQNIPDPGQSRVRGPAGSEPGRAAVLAFLSLPERWRAVLWHTEVEGAAPAAVASLFGLGATAAADLAAQARDGLASAAGISSDQAAVVLRGPVALAVLGDGAAAYLADVPSPAGAPETRIALGPPTLGPPTLGEPAMADAPGMTGSPSAAGLLPVDATLLQGGLVSHASRPGARPSAWWATTAWRRVTPGWRNAAVGAGVLLVVTAIAGYALTPGSGGGPVAPAASHAEAAASTFGLASSTPPPQATPTLTPTPSPSPVPPPAVVPSSAPRQATSAPPAARLAVSLSMAAPPPFSPVAGVNFVVSDTGSAATGTLTATLSLPGGADLLRAGQAGAWNCLTAGGAVVCTRVPLAAGDMTNDFFTVGLTRSACGQAVEMTVTSGSGGPPASASVTIHCARHAQ
ncbi:MAG: RNA polymerase sigma factor [Streptosporangiaceae bacterium]